MTPAQTQAVQKAFTAWAKENNIPSSASAWIPLAYLAAYSRQQEVIDRLRAALTHIEGATTDTYTMAAARTALKETAE